MKKVHQKALKELRNLEDKVTLPANKGNATVVMKRSDYDEKMRGMLDDTTTYRRLRKNPTATQEARIVCELLQLRNNGEITKSIYNRIRPSGSCPPRIYGFPKYVSRRSCLGPWFVHRCPFVQAFKVHCIRYFPPGWKDQFPHSEFEALCRYDAGGTCEGGGGSHQLRCHLNLLFTNVPMNKAVYVIHRKLAAEEDDDLVVRDSHEY